MGDNALPGFLVCPLPSSIVRANASSFYSAEPELSVEDWFWLSSGDTESVVSVSVVVVVLLERWFCVDGDEAGSGVYDGVVVEVPVEVRS